MDAKIELGTGIVGMLLEIPFVQFDRLFRAVHASQEPAKAADGHKIAGPGRSGTRIELPGFIVGTVCIELLRVGQQNVRTIWIPLNELLVEFGGLPRVAGFVQRSGLIQKMRLASPRHIHPYFLAERGTNPEKYKKTPHQEEPRYAFCLEHS